ncbi:hypothetical protein [Parasphingorhabdus sp.]|uniref:hypothetical protein n=1 Tax=Parasphingorhabdus sp. TaxID=2709688 RepID=UPI0032F0799C
MATLAAGTLIYAVTARQRNPEAPWLCLGTLLVSFYEPVGDLHAQVTYHEIGQISFWAAYGFRIPLWVPFSYVGFFGLSVILLLGQLDRKAMQVRGWAALFGGAWLGSFLFEAPMIAVGFVRYYADPEPLAILGYPIWMGCVNAATIFVVATSVWFLKRSPLLALNPAIFAVLLPMLFIGAHGAASLPVGSLQNGSWSANAVQIGALLSIALSLFFVWVCAKMHSAALPGKRP